MCAGIEYLCDGQRVCVYFGSTRVTLPIRRRDGGISFFRWGALRACDYADDNLNGHAKRFPEENHARLEDIRAGKWASYEPRPVRILAARFIQIDPMIGAVYFPLKRGQFIQGLLASIGDNHRVYIVTVSAPPEYADRWPEWPRIIGNLTQRG